MGADTLTLPKKNLEKEVIAENTPAIPWERIPDIPAKMNEVRVEIAVHGKVFSMRYSVPDAPGLVSESDANLRWFDEWVRDALRRKLGRTLPCSS